MKESYAEGLASHGGPESCVRTRKGSDEALTGVSAGRVLSRVIHAPWGDRGRSGVPRWWIRTEGHIGACRNGEAAPNPARSQTTSRRGNILHGNREIPHPSAPRWEACDAERIVKPKGARR
jgi:hypothetical protein